MKKFLTSLLVSLVVFSTMALPVFAAEMAGGEEFVFPAVDIVNDDYYVGGGMVDLSGKVMGDLVAAGGMLTVEGNVVGDILAAGGDVSLTGNVTDDVRVVGGQVAISANIAGDLIVAGGTVKLLPSSVVNGDILVAGGSVIMNGVVNGDVNMVGGELSLNGTIRGNLDAKLENLRLGDVAVVNGNVTYKSPNEMRMSETAVIGGQVEYVEVEGFDNLQGFITDIIIGVYLVKFLIALVGALLLAFLFNKGVTGVVETGLKKFGMNLLIGLGVLILTPIAGVLLLVTILGMPLGFVVLSLYSVFLILASILSGIMFGSWLFKTFGKGKKYLVEWKRVVVGVFLLTLLGAIPVFGWVLSAAFFFAALGGLTQFVKGMVKKNLV